MVLYLCVLIVFSLRRESLKLILTENPSPRWFCHSKINDYPHFDLTEDGRLCSTGQHCPGFLRVLYDALIRLGYDGDSPVYRCRLSTTHSMDQCKVSMMIPFDPTEPWSGSIIGSEPDTGVELMAHIALTSL
jgi:hypothetical protein